MKIKELIIEGFKSYQKQVILTEFDSQFNCLTGQNGTGKSNILEAIFFAIGFNFRNSKLSRVSNPRDLIYKRGQSSVQKAKVIIKFCNRDKTKSPVGYEDKDDLILERSISSIDNKGKFKLNSVTKKPSQIKAIFKSIRLNVDNSNTFFVQQGKVAEIVKFHPMDLMKFVEESAGVSYFNSVKQETERSMELNEPKLQSCIEGVEKLENDQMKNEEQIQIFKQYKTIEQQLSKLKLNEEYYKRKQGKEDLIRNDKDIKNLQEQEILLKQQITAAKKQYEQKLKEIQKFEIEEKQQVDKNLKAQQDHFKNDLNNINLQIDDLQVQIENFQDKQKKQNQDNKRKKFLKEEKIILKNSLMEQFKGLKLQIQKNKLEKKDYETYVKEKNNKKQQTEFLRSKFDQAKQEYLKIQENVKSEELKILNLEKKLQKCEDQLTTNNDKYETLRSKHNHFLEQQKQLDTQYDEIRKNKEKISEYKSQKGNYQRQLGQIERKIQQEVGKFESFLEIRNLYQIRQRFDESQFFLKVHNIITVKDPNKFNTALETIAGKKLFNYVVSDENISTELMSSKLLKGDIQIIPNSKIISKSIDINKISQAKSIAAKMGQEVWTPQELIQYPQDLERTINYVFQNILICSNNNIAKRICFEERNLRLDCVTLSGDTYSPHGQISGGYRQNRASFLELSQIYKSLFRDYQEILNKREKCQQKENNLNNIYQEEKVLKQNIYQNGQKMNDIQNKIDQLKLENIKNQIESTKTQIKYQNEQLQKQLKRLEQQKELKTKYQKEMQQSKSKIKNNFFEERLQELDNLLLQLNKDKEYIEKKIKETEMFLESLSDLNQENQQKINEQNEKLLQEKSILLQQKEEEKNQLQKQIDEISQEIYQQQNQQNFLEQKENDLNLEKENLNQQIESYSEQLITCKDDLKLKKEYKKDLEQNYNNKNRRHFDQREMQIEEENKEESREMITQKLQQIKQEIIRLKNEQDNIKKRINFDIEEIYNKGYKKLLVFKEQKEETVRNKNNLKQSIQVLTQKSFETVNRCFEEVNDHLSKIFGIFLPGMFAKMEMIDVYNKKKDLTEKGIQIKVRIGQKWKQSLGELSGGQRTLLALSFLLSLLKYNSAPFYIFDEVDAALDQSNTENLELVFYYIFK